MNNRDAEPYYFYAKILVSEGRYTDARRVFYRAVTNITNLQSLTRLYSYWASIEASDLNFYRAEKLYALALQCLPATEPNVLPDTVRPSSYSKTSAAKERGKILYDMAKLHVESNPYKARNLLAQSLCFNTNLSEAWELWSDLIMDYDDALAEEIRSNAHVMDGSIDLSGVRGMGKAPWNNVYNIDSIGENLRNLAVERN